MSINKKYKDRLFRLLFGEEEYKSNALDLYNAINGTEYNNVDDIRLYTIDDVIYIDMKNDVALIFDSYLSLWEHQSTPNPNMPLRGLMYFGKLYDKYIEEHRLNIYGHSLIKIPAPQYTVFYNGTKGAPAVSRLKLSDAFMESVADGGYEWTAVVYNINPGMNDELLDKCKPLKEYMQLVLKIREFSERGVPIEEAVDEAVSYCIENDILKTILVSHRAEVKDMCITEYNEEVFVNGIRAEGRAEGRKEGRKEGENDALSRLTQNIMKEQKLSYDEALKKAKSWLR